jgi:hypothetical protein
MLREEPPLEGHILLAVLTDRVMHHLMEAILAHMEPILMAPLALAEDLAWAEDSAEAEDLAGVEAWEEDGGKLRNWALGAVLEYLPRLLL